MARFVRVSTQPRTPSPFGAFGAATYLPPGCQWIDGKVVCPGGASDPTALRQQIMSGEVSGVRVPGFVPEDVVEAAKKSPPWLPLGLAAALIAIFFWKGK